MVTQNVLKTQNVNQRFSTPIQRMLSRRNFFLDIINDLGTFKWRASVLRGHNYHGYNELIVVTHLKYFVKKGYFNTKIYTVVTMSLL